jgi:Secretion system C-terminal sorting domain
MKVKLFTTVLFVCLVWGMIAQINFERTYDIVAKDEGNDIEQTIDGNYAFLSTFIGGYSSVYLSGLDLAGNPLWNYTYPNGTLTGIRLLAIQKTADKGFLVFGDSIYCPIIACLNDIYVIKVDSIGQKQWSKSYTLNYSYYFKDRKPTLDDGFMLLGNGPTGGSVILKINALGALEWTKNYTYPSGQGWLNLVAIQPTDDGGYVMTGSGKFGSRQLLLFKINSVGDTLWTKNFGDGALTATSYYKGKSVLVDSHNDILVLADTSDGNGKTDISLMKTDPLGNTLWHNKYGGTADDVAVTIEQTSDNGLIVLANTKSFGNGGFDIYVIKTDSIGNTLWTKTFGSTRNDIAKSFKKTEDNGFIIIGSTQVDSLNSDVFIVKIDSLGNILSSTFENDALYSEITVFPNPFSTQITLQINLNLKEASLTVYNLSGQQVKQINNINADAGQPIILSREQLPSGQYFVSIVANDKVVASKRIMVF